MNHSLRATSTSRLYQSGVDEQLVMERTGHRSLTGVRSYKRTSDEQREALSDILNGRRKVARTEQNPSISATSSSSSEKTISLSVSLSLSSTSFSGCTVNFYVGKTSSNTVYTSITSRMLSIFGARERPNLSAGCMSNAFRRRERNALPFSMVFVSASVHLLIYARTR